MVRRVTLPGNDLDNTTARGVTVSQTASQTLEYASLLNGDLYPLTALRRSGLRVDSQSLASKRPIIRRQRDLLG